MYHIYRRNAGIPDLFTAYELAQGLLLSSIQEESVYQKPGFVAQLEVWQGLNRDLLYPGMICVRSVKTLTELSWADGIEGIESIEGIDPDHLRMVLSLGEQIILGQKASSAFSNRNILWRESNWTGHVRRRQESHGLMLYCAH